MSSATKVRFCGLQRQGNAIHFALLTTVGGEFIPGGVVRCDVSDDKIRYRAKIGTRPLVELAETDVQASLREFMQGLMGLGVTQVLIKPRAGTVRFFSDDMCDEHFVRVGHLADQAYKSRDKGTDREVKVKLKYSTSFAPGTA